jgi:hypothetical protein
MTFAQQMDELRSGLGSSAETWPKLFATVKPNGRPAINAPSPLWQGALFQELILGSSTNAIKRDQWFSAAAVNGWVWARFDASPGESPSRIGAEVLQFLDHLERLGYLRASGGDVLRRPAFFAAQPC